MVCLMSMQRTSEFFEGLYLYVMVLYWISWLSSQRSFSQRYAICKHTQE